MSIHFFRVILSGVKNVKNWINFFVIICIGGLWQLKSVQLLNIEYIFESTLIKQTKSLIHHSLLFSLIGSLEYYGFYYNNTNNNNNNNN